MAAAQTPPIKTTEIDGRVISEPTSGLVHVEIEQPVDPVALVIGQAVAFRSTGDHESEDRYLGTVLALNAPNEVTLMLDRVARTVALTAEDREVSPYDPVKVVSADGTIRCYH